MTEPMTHGAIHPRREPGGTHRGAEAALRGHRTPVLLQLLLVAALAASTAGCGAKQRDFAGRGTGGAGGDGAPSSGVGAGMGGEGASSAGSGGSCTRPSDCPTPAGPCQVAACVGGRCGTAPLPEGTEVEPMDGDCRRTLCDEDGAPYVVPADESPDDGNPCTKDSCDGTEPTHVVQPYEACPFGICDEAGDCCDEAGNCCDEPDGCAPAGECVEDDDCGPPDECHEHVCVEGLCVDKPYPAGTPCNGGKDQCDGEDRCVDCVDDDGCVHDCPFGGGGCVSCCACVESTCVSWVD